MNKGVEGLHYDATSATDGKINVQNVKSADLQKVVEQIKKGNMHKIAQVSTPGKQRWGRGRGEGRGEEARGEEKGEEETQLRCLCFSFLFSSIYKNN